MTERTDWKAKFLEARDYAERLETELGGVREHLGQQQRQIEVLEGEVEQLHKQIGRAKLEGIKGITDFLLESE